VAENVTLPGTGEIVSAAEVAGAKIQRVYVTPEPLTANAPAVVAVASTATIVLVANLHRRGVTLCNRSGDLISIAFAPSAPVLNSGITLDAGSSWKMDVDSFTTAQINAIAADSDSNLAIQEFEI
jgi:hypothetical protein